MPADRIHGTFRADYQVDELGEDPFRRESRQVLVLETLSAQWPQLLKDVKQRLHKSKLLVDDLGVESSGVIQRAAGGQGGGATSCPCAPSARRSALA